MSLNIYYRKAETWFRGIQKEIFRGRGYKIGSIRKTRYKNKNKSIAMINLSMSAKDFYKLDSNNFKEMQNEIKYVRLKEK